MELTLTGKVWYFDKYDRDAPIFKGVRRGDLIAYPTQVYVWGNSEHNRILNWEGILPVEGTTAVIGLLGQRGEKHCARIN